MDSRGLLYGRVVHNMKHFFSLKQIMYYKFTFKNSKMISVSAHHIFVSKIHVQFEAVLWRCQTNKVKNLGVRITFTCNNCVFTCDEKQSKQKISHMHTEIAIFQHYEKNTRMYRGRKGV